MIKVLHFFKTYYPNSFGGIEQVIYQLAEGCKPSGVESSVLSLSTKGAVQNGPIGHHMAYYSKTLCEFASTPLSLSVFSDFKRLAAEADVIHYHFPWPVMDLVHFATMVKKPSIVTYHSDIVKQKNLLRCYTPLMNSFLGSVDRIVASSPNYFASSPQLQKFKDKVSVIPFGIDKASYPQVSEEKLQYWRDRLGERFFLFVGAFRYYKGLHILIQAAQGTNYPIVLVGGGAAEKTLKEQAAALGVDNVHFLGALDDEDKTALLQLSYAAVFPSFLRSEAFGISLLESAMYGKPIICCEIGSGMTYINIDGVTGIAIKPEDPASLRNAMDTLWDDPELTKQYGMNAEQRFQEMFTSNTMVDSYLELYRSVCNK